MLAGRRFRGVMVEVENRGRGKGSLCIPCWAQGITALIVLEECWGSDRGQDVGGGRDGRSDGRRGMGFSSRW